MPSEDDNKIEFSSDMRVDEVLTALLRSMDQPLHGIEGSVSILLSDKQEFHEYAIELIQNWAILLRMLQSAGQDYMNTKSDKTE